MWSMSQQACDRVPAASVVSTVNCLAWENEEVFRPIPNLPSDPRSRSPTGLPRVIPVRRSARLIPSPLSRTATHEPSLPAQWKVSATSVACAVMLLSMRSASAACGVYPRLARARMVPAGSGGRWVPL